MGTETARFDLIATLGPSSWNLVGEMVRAGATALRVNSSHVKAGALAPILRRAREQHASVPIIVDLQGAKMRLGELAKRRVRTGETLVLSLSPKAGSLEANTPKPDRLEASSPKAPEPSSKRRQGRRKNTAEKSDGRMATKDSGCDANFRIDVPIPHPELFSGTSKGDTLTIGDGRLKLRVMSVGRDHLEAHALCDGLLLPRKGVNIVEHPIDLGELTESDEAFIEQARGFPEVSWAYSFMHDGREADWIRGRMPGSLIAGKIERVEAIDSLESISSSVDAIWICRGDLGEQLGTSGLARFVSALDPKRFETPILMAGQVLEHLTRHKTPTRSEICHLHDLVERGYAGIILSDETAIGVDPTNVVGSANDLIRAFLT